LDICIVFVFVVEEGRRKKESEIKRRWEHTLSKRWRLRQGQGEARQGRLKGSRHMYMHAAYVITRTMRQAVWSEK
jgi:hypothetical protein